MKKIMKCAVVAAITITFLGTSSICAQEWTKEQKEVWKVVENMWSNWKAGDMEAAFTNVHENYLGWNDEMPLPESKAKWVGSMKEMKDQFSKQDYDVEPARILVQGDCAVVHYYYNYSMLITDGDDMNKFQDHGKWSEFFIKEGGKWMLIGDFTCSASDD